MNGLIKTQESDLKISCYSFRGSEPIQRFLEHVCQSSEQQKEAMTAFHRVGKTLYAGVGWNRAIQRRALSLDAIAMEREKKATLVNDIATYLAPESRKYYMDKGIPWRRGYLLFGPPGTGKTSLCAAPASEFSLSVFFISLTDTSLNDEALQTLFDELPARCLVVLEDIDSAGIVRETMRAPEPTAPAPTQGGFQGGMFGSAPAPRKITLSGLLNVIDGPCRHEGRVLIVTSNSPNSRDPALVRPGRIDMKVLFGNAGTEVMELLFVKILSDNPAVKLSTAEIETLSKKFSAAIPDDTLTPAEIQNWLLQNRTDPYAAANNAAAWAAPLIATKASGQNVADFSGNITSATQTSGAARDSNAGAPESVSDDSGIDSDSS